MSRDILRRTTRGMRQLGPAAGCTLMHLFFLCAALMFGCESTPHRVHRLEAERNLNRLRSRVKFQLATQLVQQGRVDDAVSTLRQAVQLDPHSSAYHRSLAKCYLEQGQVGAAAAETDVAEGLGDTSADLAYIRGMIAQRRLQFDEAFEQYKLAQERDATSVDYLLATAECLVALDRAPQARAMIDEGIDDFDRDSKLLLLRAHICILLNDMEQAVADFAGAGDLINDTVWNVEQYGLALVSMGRYADAIGVLQPLVETTPFLPGAVRALAICYSRTQSLDAAKKLLQQYLRENPRDAKALWLLAETSLKLADWQTAAQCARNGVTIAPDLPHWQLIGAYIAWQRDEETAH